MPGISRCDVDTSALAKWYLPEAGADEFASFIVALDEALTSRLTVVELRCLLGRRCRAGGISKQERDAAYHRFNEQVARGYIEIVAVPNSRFGEALRLIEILEASPLRTLDALHLAAARAALDNGLATADKVVAEAGHQLGIKVAYFGAS